MEIKIDICPICEEPAHASESDELSRHAHCQPQELCGYCGSSEPPRDDLWENQDWPRCPDCLGC